jgi:beta-galactosidase
MRSLALCSLVLFTASSLFAQPAAHRLVFDATASGPAPRPVPTQLGDNRTPDGRTLTVNSQYLMRDGTPWIPVMGEFHFTRYPEAYWEEEILKMKASGVQVVATYIIWIHHEEIEGQFDWTGRRDLRKFAQLCAKHGMLLYPRIGPWAHAEARNGGLPDWVLKKSAVRSNNPVYLAEVNRFYAQIGQQLHGLLWKDGGPVIGIQIENEYGLRGPGKGREHLATLKKMAIESGLDVPLYTVTGWDNAVVPDDLFLPVYGGYPAAPWDEGTSTLPPSEVYAFRFANRVASNMRALTGMDAATAHRDAELRAAVPFLTAEVGGGIQDTYHRRPVLAPSDVAAMIPVMIGSGANLLGYYMYQGGENPDGKLTTLQESQRTNYPTDVPVKSYDFQAPLGEFGQMNPGLADLKLDNYFLNDFGKELAPARAIEPNPHPGGPEDMSVLRASMRIQGKSGFLFVNNYIREHKMPAWPATQFELKVPGKTILVPATPITVPANSYFYWPVNLNLDGVPLSYATAQPILKTRSGSDNFVFFAAIPGIPVEFAFPAEFRSAFKAKRGSVVEKDGLLRVQDVAPGRDIALTIHGKTGVTHLVVLSAKDAKCLWRIGIDGHDVLLLTRAQVFSEGKRLIMRQIGDPVFDFSLFRALPAIAGDEAMKAQEASSGLFQRSTRRVAERRIAVDLVRTRTFGKAPAPFLGSKSAWRATGVAMAPDESSFAQAGEWRVTLPQGALNGLSDLYLRIRYEGDEARLLMGDRLLTDNLFNGAEWTIGLKRFLPVSAASTFTLEILPLSQKAPIFFEPGMAPLFGKDGQAGLLQSVKALPEYEVDLPL